eukprot:503326_1
MAERIKVYTRIYSPDDAKNETIIKECKVNSFNIDNTHHIFDCVENNVTQQKMFNDVGKPLINKFLSGFNATLFAYGQTGSGKTYTIQGDIWNIGAMGILPRMVHALFSDIQSQTTSNTTHSVIARFYQIYNKEINDCIESKNTNLQILHTRNIIKDMSAHTITNYTDFIQKYKIAIKHRKQRATKMNDVSSRSHFITEIEITRKKIMIHKNQKMESKRSSKLLVIDLAGSESQKRTESSGQALREASGINKSLSFLSMVIRDIISNKSKSINIGYMYRNCKLTEILKNSLGGNSLTFMIACVNDSTKDKVETLSTLKFAKDIKKIKNKIEKNQEQTTSQYIKMHHTIKNLQNEKAQIQNEKAHLQNKHTKLNEKYLKLVVEHNKLQKKPNKSNDINSWQLQQDQLELEINLKTCELNRLYEQSSNDTTTIEQLEKEVKILKHDKNKLILKINEINSNLNNNYNNNAMNELEQISENNIINNMNHQHRLHSNMRRNIQKQKVIKLVPPTPATKRGIEDMPMNDIKKKLRDRNIQYNPTKSELATLLFNAKNNNDDQKEQILKDNFSPTEEQWEVLYPLWKNGQWKLLSEIVFNDLHKDDCWFANLIKKFKESTK